MKATRFLAVWFLILGFTYIVFSAVGAVPAEVEILNGRITGFFERSIKFPSFISGAVLAENKNEENENEDELFWESILPERIIIKKIGVDSPVLNPESTMTAVLDRALREGVVRYPGSGGLGDKSNMLLFGHSTPLRDLVNNSYQAFNGLDQLTLGDTIEIWSGSTGHIYQVIAIYQSDKDKTLIEFNSDASILTLSTCDSFGSKSDRIVVEAKLVQVLP